MQAEGGQVIDNGKYVVLWRREAGQWKLHRDIWNSSQPAPGS
jgi:ketosteroid isomerase-like protein